MAESAPEITLVQYGGASRGMTMSHPCGKVHMALAFKDAAHMKRGIVAWVEKEGVIKPDEKVTARVWEQWIY